MGIKINGIDMQDVLDQQHSRLKQQKEGFDLLSVKVNMQSEAITKLFEEIDQLRNLVNLTAENLATLSSVVAMLTEKG